MSGAKATELERLEREVVDCRLCPRLVRYRETVPPRAAFRSQEYWRKPVPGFGDPRAWLMVLGLAPSAHGGNRTGRVFTGDESGRFLVRALYETGFANQPTSLSRGDGLRLEGCFIGAAARCAPPDNRPTPAEFDRCRPYLERELELLSGLRAVVALGQAAFGAYVDLARRRGARVGSGGFAHGARIRIDGMPWLYCSYHPSPQNTYTGRLTAEMLNGVFEAAKADRPADRA
ncbi:MAG: uracil-DNA glycosylase [Nitrososphaerales archaeon]|jgi:uracil-DNA glycosylase family 4